ncbi:hypothetical protein X759_12105 [Mesorhizobium sp. LSHC420B00]|nr:hypothetical protein X759_12105 [Mesorhizobium sp. LSHC420B00]
MADFALKWAKSASLSPQHSVDYFRMKTSKDRGRAILCWLVCPILLLFVVRLCAAA